MKTLQFILKKLTGALITIVAIAIANFAIFRIAPGDPIRMMFKDPRVSTEQLQAMRVKFGLDKSIGGQFIDYVKQLLHGNLGFSFWQKRPVADVIGDRIGQTLILVVTALVIATTLGIILGAISGWRNGSKTDRTILSLSLVLYSIPTFAMGILLLLVFGFILLLFPLGGITTPASGFTGFMYLKDVLWHMVLPAFSIVLWYVGEYILLTRSSMVEVMDQDYIVTARSKGLRESVILRKHALRNALLPVVTLSGVNFAFAIAGVIEAETVFSWPGIGRLTYDAVMKRDYPLLQGIFLLFAVSVVVANFIVDLIYTRIDPRIKTGAAHE
ncbi:MAG: ABC transporter permease [Spirochaetes bacterium]|nr:MAG: ABC transporter permease [Spirochaetota bacterium]